MTRALLLLIVPLIAAASAPVQPVQQPIEVELRTARAEQRSAERRAAELAKAAAAARGRTERLRAEQAAAAQAIEASEARITAADAQLRQVAATIELNRRRLTQQQQPIASLLAGLAVMGERPPLLAIANSSSTDDVVAVRTLIDATMPIIRRRTAGLSSQLADGERLQRQLATARSELAESQAALVDRRTRFDRLEQDAAREASAMSGEALSSGDLAIAAGEDVERIAGDSARASSAGAIARELAIEGPAPAGPERSAATSAAIPYILPADVAVTEGTGSVSRSGVRSRGVTLATSRGAAVFAPAAGIVRFAGPFKSYDGVVIIDHGGGWITLLVGVSSPSSRGRRVAQGERIGLALGQIQVELSQNGRRVSPALIAGSSRRLSNGGKAG